MATAVGPEFEYGYPTPGLQSPTGQDVMDQVYFVSESEWEKILVEKERFDHIVIRTGPCGLAFINRILYSHPNCRILVVERGG